MDHWDLGNIVSIFSYPRVHVPPEEHTLMEEKSGASKKQPISGLWKMGGPRLTGSVWPQGIITLGCPNHGLCKQSKEYLRVSMGTFIFLSAEKFLVAWLVAWATVLCWQLWSFSWQLKIRTVTNESVEFSSELSVRLVIHFETYILWMLWIQCNVAVEVSTFKLDSINFMVWLNVWITRTLGWTYVPSESTLQDWHLQWV